MPIAESQQAQAHTALRGALDEPRVPFVPTPLPIVEKMLELARVSSNDVVYDLGSGDGRTVVMAAQKFGAEAVGVELDDERFKESSARVAALRLGRRARILHGNLFDTDLRRATVVTMYLLSGVNERLRPILESQLRPGTRVVAHDFPVPGWKPEQVVSRGLGDSAPHALYLYVIGQQKEETMAATQSGRAYTADRYALELNGAIVGWLFSAEGGNASADVVVEKLGPDGVVHKHIAGVKYEDITIQCGTGMSQSFYDWLTETLQQKYSRKKGALIGTDFNGLELSRLEFYNALVSEIGLPALDASSKEAARLTVKIKPEYTRLNAGSKAKTSSGASKMAQKNWLPSNFRLKIDGLDCTHVNKIEAITLKQHVVENAVGEFRTSQQEPSYLEVPNLVVTMAESHAQDFYDWLELFVIKGQSGQENEKSGTLEYFTPNLQEVLFTLSFKGLGIFKLSPDKWGAGSEAIHRVRAEMYCEEMEFAPAAGLSGTVGASAKSKGVSSSSAESRWTRSREPEEEVASRGEQTLSEAEYKAWKETALKELLKEVAFTIKQTPQATELARQGPPLRFRT